MNISLRADDFRVVLHPPFPGEVIYVAKIYGRFHGRRGLLNWLNKAMPDWRKQIVLCEELYDAKEGLWIDCMSSFKEQS